MKKLILFLTLVIGFAFAQAQTVSHAPMGVGFTVQTITTDYTLSNTTVRNFIFNAAQSKPTTQDFVIDLDSLAGNHTNVAVEVYGQKSTIKGDWTQIGSTVNWKGTTADTTILIKSLLKYVINKN